MIIISHHPAHQDEVLTRGLAVINGLTFRPGEGGKPTYDEATDADCTLFVGVPGYQFLHEDGALIGETTLKEKALGLDAITEALKNRTVTLDEVRAMNLEIPGIGNLNGLIDGLLDPANSRTDEAQPSPNELEEQAQIATMLGVDPSQITFDGDNIIVDYPEGMTFTAESQVRAGDEQESGDETDAILSEDPELLARAARLENGEATLIPLEDVANFYRTNDEDRTETAAPPVDNTDSAQSNTVQLEEPEQTPSKPADDGHGDKAAIKAKLSELGVDFGPRDNRSELVRKLEEAQAKK